MSEEIASAALDTPKTAEDAVAGREGTGRTGTDKAGPQGPVSKTQGTEETGSKAGALLSLCSTTKRIAKEHPIASIPIVNTFLRLPTDLFYHYELAVSEAADKSVYEDASAYYAITNEMYNKLDVLLTLIDFKSDGHAYTDLNQAVLDTGRRIAGLKIEPDNLKKYILKEYENCAVTYFMQSKLVLAPLVLPEPIRQFSSIQEALDYTLISADVLFHLARFGSADTYLSSGYADPAMRSVPNVHAAYNYMLSEYKEMAIRMKHKGS